MPEWILTKRVKWTSKNFANAHEKLFSLSRESLKPIVMAVDGAALGGGLGLVAQGHCVFASEAAAFGLPEIGVGLWPFLVYRSLVDAIGPRRRFGPQSYGRILSCCRCS